MKGHWSVKTCEKRNVKDNPECGYSGLGVCGKMLFVFLKKSICMEPGDEYG